MYEKILKSNPSAEDREATIYQLTVLYCRMGQYEKAKALANDQNSITICKELMLPMATVGAEKVRYQGERLTSLLENLYFAISESIALRPYLQDSGYANQLLLSFTHLFETVFVDGKFGKWHGDMGSLYLLLASYEMKHDGSLKNALLYFDRAFEHYQEYRCVCNEEEYSYSAPLVSGLAPLKKGDLDPANIGNFWKKKFMMFSTDFVAELRKNPKYAECFE